MSNVIIACPSSVCPSLLVNIGSGATLRKEATLSGRLCERTIRRDCVKLESMDAEGTWYGGTWNDWCWKTLDHWSSSSSLTPQAGTQYSWTGQNGNRERYSLWSKRGSPQWNSPVETMSNDPRQYDDGWGEVIPSFDGTDFRQYERRVRLFVLKHEWPQREGLVNFWSDSKDVPSICVKESRTWKHRMVLRIFLIT